MPSRMVVPGVMAPVLPCHSIVQPPHWMPMSSAASPATKISGASFFSGKAALSFLSSTSDLRTASRASARCASEPTWPSALGPGHRMLEQAQLELHRQDAPHGIVDARSGTSPCSDRLGSARR